MWTPISKAAAGKFGRLDRVVVISGVFRIHGQDEAAAQVLTAPQIARSDSGSGSLRLGECRRGKLVPDPMPRKYGEELRPWVVGGAEHCGHFPDHRLPGRGEAANPDFHEIPGASAAGRYENLARPLPIPDRDGPLPGEQPDNPGGRAGEYPHDRALQPAAPGAERNLGLDQVPRQGPTDPAGSDVDVFQGFMALGDNPAVALRSPLKAPPNHAGRIALVPPAPPRAVTRSGHHAARLARSAGRSGGTADALRSGRSTPCECQGSNPCFGTALVGVGVGRTGLDAGRFVNRTGLCSGRPTPTPNGTSCLEWKLAASMSCGSEP